MSKGEQQTTRGGFIPVGDLALDLPDVQVPARRQARHFTTLDKVTQLVGVRDADPDLGFMARLLALCSLPRTDPKNRLQYVRRNGPYALVMSAGGLNKLPYGNIPRLLLAWVCTEAVRTQSRELVLGASLSEFMDKLGMAPRPQYGGLVTQQWTEASGSVQDLAAVSGQEGDVAVHGRVIGFKSSHHGRRGQFSFSWFK